MGVALSILGPAVSYLEDRLGVGAGVIGVLFALSAAGNFVGAMLGGRWIDSIGGHATLTIGVVGFVTGAVLIAAGSEYLVVASGVTLVGAATGAADAAMNTMVVWARVGRSGPALNALHLMFGVGALIAPLAVDRSLAWSSGLWYVAALVGAIGLISVILLLGHRAPAAPTPEDHIERPPMSTSTTASVAFFFLLYVGAEIGFGGWIFTFAEDRNLAGSAPALVTAAFWGAFALGRLLAIPVSRVSRPVTIVVSSCAMSVVALLVMVVADGAVWSVWSGAVVYGLSAGPQYPTMIALVDTRLSLTARATSWIVGAAAIGALIVPTGIGPLIESYGSSTMPKMVLGVSAAGFVWAVLVGRLINRASAPRRTDVLHPA
ncbi:MAG: MFS transporter [Actinobacteria bacterium]|nr:MFS transporter [Actinomycetota bacterium]